MDRASKAIRRSTGLLSNDSNTGHLLQSVNDFQKLNSTFAKAAEAQQAAADQLFKWAKSEDNHAVKDIAQNFSELMTIWSRVQLGFCSRLSDAADKFGPICECSSRIDAAQRDLDDFRSREETAQRSVQRAMKWRKGGDIRLLEQQTEELKAKRVEAEELLVRMKREAEVIKSMRFKAGLQRVASVYVELGQACGEIFTAAGEVAAQIPDVTASTLGTTTYEASRHTRLRVSMARDRVRHMFPARQSMRRSTSSGVLRSFRTNCRRTPRSRRSCPSNLAAVGPPPSYEEALLLEETNEEVEELSAAGVTTRSASQP